MKNSLSVPYALFAVILVACITLGVFCGYAVTMKSAPYLCYAETVAVTPDNEVYAQTQDGNIWSWYEDGETPIADLYVLALVDGRVEDALPVHIANVVTVRG